ncbi:MAG: tRNA (guanosine(37)-N1)-methyltransferase TrmD [Candidatus Ratteibacteria bacterium]|jgi:tRNA (guanine37-N1)-methyltransferase
MRIDVITIFPEAFLPLDLSIIGRAREAGFLDLRVHNLRDFTTDRHRKVDDKSFGGGVGMVMMVGPVAKALGKIRKDNPKAEIIMLSPAGRVLDQPLARKFSRKKGLILICGHYEGMDERVVELCDRQLSIGDYVLSAGETAALVVIDAVTRLLPGVLPEGAAEQDSFSGNLLDWPHYTRPARWRGVGVPEVLLSGDHKKIAAWRQKTAEERTKKLRPDLWKKYDHQKTGRTLPEKKGFGG